MACDLRKVFADVSKSWREMAVTGLVAVRFEQVVKHCQAASYTKNEVCTGSRARPNSGACEYQREKVSMAILHFLLSLASSKNDSHVPQCGCRIRICPQRRPHC